MEAVLVVAYLRSAVDHGYLIFVPLLLILRLFKKEPIRNESTNILSAANLILSVVFIFEMILYASELFVAYHGRHEYEVFAFAQNPYVQFFFPVTILIYLISLLFLLKLLRKSWLLSLIMLLLLVFVLFPSLYISLMRDYLPSAWKTYYPNPIGRMILKVLLFGIMTFVIYFLLAKIKKLPYPSYWVK